MKVVRVFVTDPQAPSDAAASAITRAQAAAKRCPGGACVRTLPLDCDDALELGVSVDPTIAVGDLVVAVGQVPVAGHLLRALEAAPEETSQ